jgi:hypothetical protein
MAPTCAQMYIKRCKERNRELDELLGGDIATEWLSMSDEEIFNTVVTDDKDHFTFEFLKQRGWENNEASQEFFDRYVGLSIDLACGVLIVFAGSM